MALNVLFKGVYRQNDGWGLASRDYLRALSQTDCNVQAQNVFLSSHRDETVPEWIEELEKNTLTPDVIIHNVLPHTVELDHNAKNIWLGYTETGALNNSGWLPYWQNMDAVWCPTYVELNNLIKAGVEHAKAHVVPMPVNLTELRGVQPLEGEYKDAFTFLFLGAPTIRKNFYAALQAYCREFKKSENTLLVMKVSLGENTSGQQFLDHIYKFMFSLRLYEQADLFPNIHCIVERISRLEILGLQKAANLLVTPSLGESTCRPVLESAFMGTPCAVTEGIGADDAKLDLLRIHSYEEPCLCPQSPTPYVYTGWETWQRPSVLHLQQIMRDVYNGNTVIDHQKNLEAIEKGNSYDSVARVIRNQL